MNTSVGYSVVGDGTPVVALHSSMSSKSQWKRLAARLAPDYRFIGIDLSGYGETPFPSGTRGFLLRDEAAVVNQAIGKTIGNSEPFHLIGHSYGGGTALRLAHEQPQRILTLSLYEPTPFCLLADVGAERMEIESVAAAIADLTRIDLRAATRLFIDYWNGAGSFDAMPAERQAAMTARIEKVNLDFHALINDPLSLRDCRKLNVPVCLIAGKNSLAPPLRIIEALYASLSHVIRYSIEAGHMGPVTHADEVNAIIAAFVDHHERQTSLAAVGF